MTYAWRRIALDKVISTNDEAMQRLLTGERGRLVVTARTQSGGRGRRGRTWISPPGNLYASLALRDPTTPALAPQLSFVAGAALAEALRARLGGDARLQLKWPNDVLYDGAKLAGMLLESTILPDGALGCVIGIGVNCLSHAQGLAYPATDLSSAGDSRPDCDAVLADFIERFDIQLDTWAGGTGFAATRGAWLSMAAGLGKRITVTTASRQIEGIFRELDPSGRLLLDTAEGPVAIEAGDVFLPDLPTAQIS